MSDTVIRVENLGKKYIIGHQKQERYTALRDVIANGAKGLFKSIQNPKSKIQNPTEEFWALKDVSFEIKQGDRVGIIGRNGAGKSTLLKILSRITEPTTGSIRVKGRVASLLEVGTGFHPELTGRENIFLNGAILGMSKAEISRKFDEIVAFAEVEKFLDTPVKRYSSGMYVRLAFAVAAHLEPEILVVDEVLAVGDAAFQKKCLGKMGEVASEGRTVLFVSHNMGAIKSLCTQAIWLSSGSVKDCGSSDKIVNNYFHSITTQPGTEKIAPSQHKQGNYQVLIEEVNLLGKDRMKQNSFLINESFFVQLSYSVKNHTQGSFWIFITSSNGEVILSSFQKDVQSSMILKNDGCILIGIDDIGFLPGTYSVSAGIISQHGIVDWVDQAISFEVLQQFANGQPFDHRYGFLTKEMTWITEESSANLSNPDKHTHQDFLAGIED